MGLQKESIFCIFVITLSESLKIYSGENNYSRDGIVIQCVNFYKSIFSLCLCFLGHSPTDVAPLQVILITEFH